MGSQDEFIDKVLNSIEGCLSISVGSCEKCIFKDISHPKCKNELLNISAETIKSLREVIKYDN